MDKPYLLIGFAYETYNYGENIDLDTKYFHVDSTRTGKDEAYKALRGEFGIECEIIYVVATNDKGIPETLYQYHY